MLEIFTQLNSLTQISLLSWITQTSLPICPRSQKFPKAVPSPLFVLSSHQMDQIEEESILVSVVTIVDEFQNLLSAITRAEGDFKV